MLDFAILAIFPGVMAFAAISDLLTMKIPNRASFVLIAGFLALALAVGLPLAVIGWHFAAGLLVLGVGFVLFNLGWIGGGDAKLAAATAVWLGFGQLAQYGLVAAVFGGVLTLIILQLRRIDLSEGLLARTWLSRLHDKAVGVPYGIALAAAGLAIYPDTVIWLAAKAA
jgi:prepilin peptidase CpaA